MPVTPITIIPLIRGCRGHCYACYMWSLPYLSHMVIAIPATRGHCHTCHLTRGHTWSLSYLSHLSPLHPSLGDAHDYHACHTCHHHAITPVVMPVTHAITMPITHASHTYQMLLLLHVGPLTWTRKRRRYHFTWIRKRRRIFSFLSAISPRKT